MKSKIKESKSITFNWWFLPMLVVGFLSLVLRFWQLNSIPPSLYYDEMDYVVTGMSVAEFGTDLSGHWKLSQLEPLQTFNYTSELAAGFHAVVQKTIGGGIDSAKIPNAIFSILTALSFGYFAWILSKEKVLSFLTVLVFLTNPWQIHLARMAYETPISLFFQLWVVIGVWQLSKVSILKFRIGWLVATLMSLFLAFFTYHGAKFGLLFLLPGIIFVLVWHSKNKWNLFRWYLPLIVGLVMMVSYTMLLQQQGAFGDRSQELIFSNEFLSQKVNHLSQQSILLPAQRIFLNKGTVLINEFVKQYFSVFDIYRLFISGYESGFQFSLLIHGFFYISGLLFLPFGAWYWLKNNLLEAKYLAVILLLAPLPSAITISQQSIFRSAMVYAILLVLIASGMIQLINILSKKIGLNRNILYFCLGTMMIFESIWFGWNYLGSYSLAAIDNHDFQNHLVSNYLGRVSTQSPVFVLTNRAPYDAARSFVAYNNLLGELSNQERQQFQQVAAHRFKIGNYIFVDECPEAEEFVGNWVVQAGLMTDCGLTQMLVVRHATTVSNSPLESLPAISSPKDSGSYFYLVEDSVCNAKELPSYIFANKVEDYKLDELSNDEFCSTWVKSDPIFK